MSTSVNALPIGTIIRSSTQSYRIEKVLGAGGFGITYQASTMVKFGNFASRINVAIKEHFLGKLCERETDSSRVVYSNPVKYEVENSRKDFISEAQRLHKVGVNHHNIVKVNEVFEANNTAYYVMEYLSGESLRNYVRHKSALSESAMIEVMRPIVDAVTYLHRNRMTHLDIKPDNIMITADEDDTIRPVLIDFGLSKHYDNNGRPTSTINTLGCSDGYAPIEQYAGITTFTPQADVYAMGATMLFCLTGRDPTKSTEITRADIETPLARLSQPTADTIYRAMQSNQRERPSAINLEMPHDSSHDNSGDITPPPPPPAVKSQKTVSLNRKTILLGRDNDLSVNNSRSGSLWKMLLGLEGTVPARIFGVITTLYCIAMIILSTASFDTYYPFLDNAISTVNACVLSMLSIYAYYATFAHKCFFRNSIPWIVLGITIIIWWIIGATIGFYGIIIPVIITVLIIIFFFTVHRNGKIQKVSSIVFYALCSMSVIPVCIQMALISDRNYYLSEDSIYNTMDSAVEVVTEIPDYYYYYDDIAADSCAVDSCIAAE